MYIYKKIVNNNKLCKSNRIRSVKFHKSDSNDKLIQKMTVSAFCDNFLVHKRKFIHFIKLISVLTSQVTSNNLNI